MVGLRRQVHSCCTHQGNEQWMGAVKAGDHATTCETRGMRRKMSRQHKQIDTNVDIECLECWFFLQSASSSFFME